MRNYGIVITLSVFFLSTSFYFRTDVPGKIILRVGNVAITDYELKKNLDVFISGFIHQHSHTPSDTAIKSWINEFIDRTYFLADAYEKGYDTAHDINKWVYSMAHYVISKPDGLLSEKMGQSTPVSEQELQSALLLHSKRVHISYLKFSEYNAALDFLQGKFELSSEQQFRDAFDKRFPSTLTTGKDIVQWPFLRRGVKEEAMLNMKKGELSPLLSLADGFYIVRADSIENTVNNQPADSIKNNLHRYLQLQKRQQRQTQYINDIKKQAQIKLDPQVLKVLEQYLKQSAITTFEKINFPSVYSSPMFYYKHGDTVLSILTARLADYYNTLPVRREIKNVEGLMYYIESFVYDQYAYAQAEALGITREVKFQLDKKSYLNSIIWATYETKELKEGIIVSDKEVQERYAALKNSFVQATDAVVSAFVFNERKNAVKAMMDLRSGRAKLNDNGWQAMYLNKNIHYSESFISDSIRAAVFSMKSSGVLTPALLNGKYIVIVKTSESGQRVQTLPEVQQEIKKRLALEKLIQKKQTYLIRLKAKYEVKNEIDYQKYTSKPPHEKG